MYLLYTHFFFEPILFRARVLHSQQSRRVTRARVLRSWQSHKLTRVCRPSLAAEIQGIADGLDELDFCRLAWREIEFGDVDLRNYTAALWQVPATLVSDCRSFYDSINAYESSNLGVKDKRSSIEALPIKQTVVETETPVAWCNSDAQLSDGMTKGKTAWKLIEFFTRHRAQWRLTYDDQILSAKRRKALGLGPLDEALALLAPPQFLQHLQQVAMQDNWAEPGTTRWDGP